MKLNELRSGHVVEYKNGKLRLVLLNSFKGTNILVGDEVWNGLGHYNEDMTHNDRVSGEAFDIVKVYKPNFIETVLKDLTATGGFNVKNKLDYTLLWERQEVKEMSVEEIQNILGYKIKIIDSK